MLTVPRTRRTRLRKAIAEQHASPDPTVTVSTICGFCGKGPFATVPGLHIHIHNMPACNQARQADFGSYVANIWTEVAGQPDGSAQTPENHQDGHAIDGGPGEPVQLVEEQSPIQLDQDLDNAADNFMSTAAQTQSDEDPPPQSSQRTTIKEVPDEDAIPQSSQEFYYVELYPENQKAGATWGTGTPLFESIRQQQERDSEPIWGPFADEAELGLAEWLLRNVGQKQYLSLPHLFLLDSRTPVRFLLDSRTPVGFLLDFNNSSKKGNFHLLDSYWTPTGLQLDFNKIPESEYIA
ncbi:uncharacterized protein LACBIDRAFT_330426 [Laccaria bicolor S238N-H82]|uniref:Predicted protein n=1 Tax=Laccaria bicolor (strain S238N-H82 / ATCC MYA-4686) TaxID=486041 RepID=B0DL96_LACBS|nr:uncharacterized protein LACBIDRAFT_330426 [Laccaria bicolor S238N-H82]EDR04525.1 predicted protein [Laccaria bicolor S238N-H82]|eukprot:XP_001884697.1 predicted protein [Laccaria bicolor S238N-H82]